MLKILKFAFPPSMGSKKNIDPHAAWEADFCFFQHLCSENANPKKPLLFFDGAIMVILGLPAAEVLEKYFCMISL